VAELGPERRRLLTGDAGVQFDEDDDLPLFADGVGLLLVDLVEAE